MTRYFATAILACLCYFGFATALSAQSATDGEISEFDPSLMILDTSIPFSMGSRQAQQQLRGSFGWDTYQEGVIGTTFFRFDPDGYARFAADPRLDGDVFEVTCRPRTRACVARKGALTIEVASDLKAITSLSEVLEADRLFIAEGANEIELPRRAIGKIDKQMELLIATGTELIVRRGEQIVNRVSLAGFNAVTNYLRWAAAGQTYAVLPNDWPVPSSTVQLNASAYEQAGWSTDAVQPQNQPLIQSEPVEQAVVAIAPSTPSLSGKTIEQLEIEVALLRDLVTNCHALTLGTTPDQSTSSLKNLSASTQDDILPPMTQEAGPPAMNSSAIMSELATDAMSETTSIERIIAAETDGEAPQDLASLLQEIQPNPLQAEPEQTSIGEVQAAPLEQSNEDEFNIGEADATTAEIAQTPGEAEIAERLIYLIEEFGLEPEAALNVIQMVNGNDIQTQSDTEGVMPGLVAEIETPVPSLEEPLFADLIDPPTLTSTTTFPPTQKSDDEGFVSISEFLDTMQ